MHNIQVRINETVYLQKLATDDVCFFSAFELLSFGKLWLTVLAGIFAASADKLREIALHSPTEIDVITLLGMALI